MNESTVHESTGADLDDTLRLVEQQRRSVEGSVRAAAAVSASAASPDQSVTVTLDMDGELTALTFSGAYRSMAAADLSRTVLDTVRTAQRALTEHRRVRPVDRPADPFGLVGAYSVADLDDLFLESVHHVTDLAQLSDDPPEHRQATARSGDSAHPAAGTGR